MVDVPTHPLNEIICENALEIASVLGTEDTDLLSSGWLCDTGH